MPDVDPGKQRQWQKLFDYIAGYQALWTVDVGLKSGLLRAIADQGPICDDRLAAKLGFDPGPRRSTAWINETLATEFGYST